MLFRSTICKDMYFVYFPNVGTLEWVGARYFTVSVQYEATFRKTESDGTLDTKTSQMNLVNSLNMPACLTTYCALKRKKK